jgi:hypothetical protein
MLHGEPEMVENPELACKKLAMVTREKASRER